MTMCQRPRMHSRYETSLLSRHGSAISVSLNLARKGIRIIANSFLYDNMSGICEGFAFYSQLDSDWFWKNEE
jgi:hypothetical protein